MGVAEKLLQLLQIAVLLPAILSTISLRGCPSTCGELEEIPYPFGVGENCSLNVNFSIDCDRSSDPPKAFLMDKSTNIIVTNISTTDGVLHTMTYVAKNCFTDSGVPLHDNRPYLTLSSFGISNTKNKFVVIGCDTYAYITGYLKGDNYTSGCMSLCSSNKTVMDGSCSGIGCCKVEIPRGLKGVRLEVNSFYNYTNVWEFNQCGYAMLVEDDKFNFSTSYLTNFSDEMVPSVLDWAISNQTSLPYICGENNTDNPPGGDGSEYRCQCLDGYEGNPYLPAGCTDINECASTSPKKCRYDCINTPGNYTCPCPKRYRGDARIGGDGCTPKPSFVIQIMIGIGVGLTVLIVGTSWLFLGYRKWKLIKLKEQFFEKDGGFLLQRELSARGGGEGEMANIFTQEELEKATDNFSEDAIAGKGGFGTVYKGVLEDGSVVAIKKSKVMDDTQTQQFINEVMVLSQIRHRNVVKLLGCCLETKVPLLVYEFISNGTLFGHIHHDPRKSAPLSWKIRLKIAAETADVLSYLHSSALTSIIHRDIKSANILLDEGFTAKVADFGASKLVPKDQIEMSTMVQGTLGYLDPEYLLTSELTEKSDVYSFGIVVLELLTGKKAVSFKGPENERNLAMFFLSAMKEDRLLRVLDKDLANEGDIIEMRKVAKLAKTCLSVKGDERPPMKEVARVLGGMTGAETVQYRPWEARNEEPDQGEESSYLLGQTSSMNYGVEDSLKADQIISLHGR